MNLMILALAALVASPVADKPLPALYMPAEAVPDFAVYEQCVTERYEADPRANGVDVEAARRANRDAVAACRDVREVQLARALESLKDYGWAQRQMRRHVRRAFEQFGEAFQIELVTAPQSESSSESDAED